MASIQNSRSGEGSVDSHFQNPAVGANMTNEFGEIASYSSNDASPPATTDGDSTTRTEAQRTESDLPMIEKQDSQKARRGSRDDGALKDFNDDPFGSEDGAAVQYKTMKWWHAGLLMVAETVSLGILSLPSVIAGVGFVPGIILIVSLGLMATYTGYVIGQFKLAYPQVHSFADAGQLLFGPVGKVIAEIGQAIILIFIVAAHILTFSVMMNVLTNHGTCTIVFTVIGTVVSFILTLPRTSKNIAYLSYLSCISIVVAVFIAMIGIGIENPHQSNIYAVTPSRLTSWSAGVVGVSNIVVSFSGHVAFFGIISELKKPEDFTKGSASSQSLDITSYIVVGTVIYRFAGNDVESPALSSASPMVAKVAYGIAAPTIVIAGVVNASVCVKNIYVRVWRHTNVMQERSFRAYGSWVLICALVYIIAWIIASAIPVFNQSIGLVGALLCTWFSLGASTMMWSWMNKGQYRNNWKKMSLTVSNISISAVCTAICGLGTYGTAKAISENGSTRGPFSCDDNST